MSCAHARLEAGLVRGLPQWPKTLTDLHVLQQWVVANGHQSTHHLQVLCKQSQKERVSVTDSGGDTAFVTRLSKVWEQLR